VPRSASAAGPWTASGTTNLMLLNFNRLRWISIIVPVAALGLLHSVLAFVFPDLLRSPAGFLITLGLIFSGVALFSHLVFGVIERLEREIVRQSGRFASVAGVATTLSEAEGTTEILQHVLDAVAEALDVETGVICLLNEETDELYLCAHAGLPAPLLERIRRQAVDDDAVGSEVIRHARPVVVSDASLDPRSVGLREQFGIWSFVSVPLIAENRALGVLALASGTKGRFAEEDVRLLEQIARQLGIAVHRSKLLEQLVDRNEELRVMNDVSAELTRAHDVTSVFAAVLSGAIGVTGAERAELWLDERGQIIKVHSVGPGLADGETGAPDDPDLRQRVWQTGSAEMAMSGDASTWCFPLNSADQVVGLIVLTGLRTPIMPPRRRQLLESIADQGGVAISNARFRVRVRELAVVEERERIAREMHDGLAQVLGYVNTKAFAVRRLLKDGDLTTAQSMLSQLEEAARDVYADVREGVLALRTTAPRDRSLLDNICDYLSKFERLSGVHVECHADRKMADLRLPEMTEIQVMRVIQEALSNVRKHASAEHASVTLRARNGTLVALVDDDGCGFDVKRAGRRDWPQFGLQTMRERAEAIGGRFSVTSTAGHGTHVTIRVPVAGPAGTGA